MSNSNDIINMSDEDFLKLDPASMEDDTDDDSSDDSGNNDDDNQSDEDENDDSDDNNESDSSEDDEDENDRSDDSSDGQSDSDSDDDTNKDDSSSDEGDTGSKSDDDKDKSDEGKKDDKESDSVDYAAIGRQVMSEFKANGKTMKIKNVDDAVRLMQMGSNYHKKMAGLKPSLKTLKLLEQHNLVDPEKINFLIDLSLKKPEAITQLLKDSKIDPLQIDLDSETEYTPEHREVSDTEIALDDILDKLQDSPSFKRTLTVIGEEWDMDSRTDIAANPQMIEVINGHMDNGIYDQVVKTVEYERSMGKLTGVSDFDAYQQIGQYMDDNKMFKSPAGQDNSQQESQNQQSVNNPTSNNSQSDDQGNAERKERKQAASPTRRSKAKPKSNENYNPLAMSDEEFMKLNNLNF